MNAISGLDSSTIIALVDRFYDRVREDPQLGPIFAVRVHDWPAHKNRMVTFWSSTTLRSGDYRGNPMAVHRALPLSTELFERWQWLWRDTASYMLSAPAARHMIDLAERIGHGLMQGVGLRPRNRDMGVPPAGRAHDTRGL